MSEVPLYHGNTNTPLYAPPSSYTSTTHTEKEAFINSNTAFVVYRGTSLIKKRSPLGPYWSY